MDRSAVIDLYTRKLDSYAALIGFFRSAEAVEALLAASPFLRGGLKVLDAGCGFGMASLALIGALRQRGLDYDRIDAFDLTPAMLDRFRRTINEHALAGIRLRQADVLDPLPPSWADYDLILSTSMLEYLAKPDLPRALANLRGRLKPGGTLLVKITRRTPESALIVGWKWHANRYGKDELRHAFGEAGFGRIAFRRLPWRYFWLNRGNYVVVAPV